MNKKGLEVFKDINFLISALFVIIIGSVLLTQVNSDASQLESSGSSDIAPTSESAFIQNGTNQTLAASPISLNSVTAPVNGVLRTNEFSLGDLANVSYVNVSGLQANTIFNNNFTMMMWINHTGDNALDEYFISNKDAFSSSVGFVMVRDSAFDYEFNYANGSDAFTLTTFGLTINNNEWHHIVVMYNASAVSPNGGDFGGLHLYVDGQLRRSNVSIRAPFSNSTSPFLLGTKLTVNTASQVAWNGSMDEFRLYNRSMTNAEILSINASGRVANGSLPANGLRVWYTMNEGNGTRLVNQPIGIQQGSFNGTIINNVTNPIRWNAEGGTASLAAGTDYTQSGNQFRLDSIKYSYAPITISYGSSSASSPASAALIRISALILFVGIIGYMWMHIRSRVKYD